MAPRLVLVKHSHVAVVPGRPPRTWELSGEGRRRAALLAGRLAEFDVARVVSSDEPKAVETAEIVAQRLGVPSASVAGLHEQLRDTAPYLGREDFEAAIAWLFDEPSKVVFGEESADAAADRFGAAVEALLADERAAETSTAGRDQVVVAHGTVIALYVARVAGIEPFPLWQSLGLPSYVVLSQGARRQVEIFMTVE